MPTKYKIHLKNLQSADKTFWCFLNTPDSNISSEVFANSSARLTVAQFEPGRDDSFTIPLQYVVKAGASNNAVALKTLIQSSISKNTDLASSWQANYFQANKGPALVPGSDTPASDEVDVLTNAFDKNREPLDKWFSSLTFGVQSDNGFLGVTWSPDPSETYRIKPKVQFYVATGSYEENTLASITSISTTSANITEDSFDGNYECTVTLLTTGKWKVEKGNTNQSSTLRASNALVDLSKTQLLLATAHTDLVDLIKNPQEYATSSSDNINDVAVRSEGIIITSGDKLSASLGELPNFITGSIGIATAIGVGFTAILAAGITLKIKKTKRDGLEFDFEYNGGKSLEEIIAAFGFGKEIYLHKD
jgi:hypothetical protein